MISKNSISTKRTTATTGAAVDALLVTGMCSAGR